MPKTGTRNGARNADQKCQQNATRQPKKASQPAKDCKPNPVKTNWAKNRTGPKNEHHAATVRHLSLSTLFGVIFGTHFEDPFGVSFGTHLEVVRFFKCSRTCGCAVAVSLLGSDALRARRARRCGRGAAGAALQARRGGRGAAGAAPQVPI